MIYYTESIDVIKVNHLEGFFQGWPNPPTTDTHLRLLGSSNEIVLAVDDETENVVGFITAVTDNVLGAYISFLEVLPSYQRVGIGTELMRRMLRKLSGLYTVGLLCDPEATPFYTRLAMTPTNGMMVLNHTRQSGEQQQIALRLETRQSRTIVHRQ